MRADSEWRDPAAFNAGTELEVGSALQNSEALRSGLPGSFCRSGQQALPEPRLPERLCGIKSPHTSRAAVLGLNFDVDKDRNSYFPQFARVNHPREGWEGRLLPASLTPSRPEL